LFIGKLTTFEGMRSRPELMPAAAGIRHVVTFAADRPGGFTDDEVSLLRDLLPALALVTEVRLKNRFARRLLETYVGPPKR
jgi:adenylate cyclase